MIEIQGITKHFGSRLVLNDVSFTAQDGKVTGFLGPNGAGKSTTMRSALGLVKPDSGRALFDGSEYRSNPSPMATVGAVLDAKSAHKGRSAYAHLRSLALTNGIPRKRVDEVIDITGIASVRGKKAGSFSLGMGQRLSIAAALLGDPRNLVLDEPVNGLDPEGVKWVRELCRFYAGEGRAVLLSSHLMSEVALTADDLVIIGQGRILETTNVGDFVAEHSKHVIRVVTPEPDKIRAIFAQAAEVHVEQLPPEAGAPGDATAFRITGAEIKAAARVFAQARLITYELIEEHVSLEEAYMELTHSQVQYAAKALPGQQPAIVGDPPQAVQQPSAASGSPVATGIPAVPVAPAAPAVPVGPQSATPHEERQEGGRQ